MKTKDIVKWLKRKQDELQEDYRNVISKEKGYDFRAVHITVTCGCGKNYKTPYWIKDNARCKKCGKWITTFQEPHKDKKCEKGLCSEVEE